MVNSLQVKPLSDDLPFGARVTGVCPDALADEDVRRTLNDIFLDRGVIVFEEVEPSDRMQVAISEVFGPLEDHALKGVPRAEKNDIPGLVEFRYRDIFEVNGVPLCGYVPWHFDACYTDKLNRGGVLRALAIPPAGGVTGFADGIQLYSAVAPEIRDHFEHLNIIYHSHLMFGNMRFGRPDTYKPIEVRQMVIDMLEDTRAASRSVHPAIWQRESGEKVLHVSPWQAAGIEGDETPDGDRLLEQLCREIYRKMTPYNHTWKPTDMIIWDNWRFLHAVSGHSPEHSRRMQRTTIRGDYGLGRLEKQGSEAPPGLDV
jgi:taurine dioxygenase